MTDKIETVKLSGHIKWFDDSRGYGFIVPDPEFSDQFTSDVMLHVTCLRDYGETRADEGAQITCEAVLRDRGWQVVKIIDMERPQLSIVQDAEEGLMFEPVVVKWFNASKGFGFVNRPQDAEDIFVHIAAMRKVGLDHLEPGMSLDVVIGEGKKGLNVLMIKK